MPNAGAATAASPKNASMCISQSQIIFDLPSYSWKSSSPKYFDI